MLKPPAWGKEESRHTLRCLAAASISAVRSETRASIWVVIARIWLSSWTIDSIVEGDADPGVDAPSLTFDTRDRTFGSTEALLVRGLGLGMDL